MTPKSSVINKKGVASLPLFVDNLRKVSMNGKIVRLVISLLLAIAAVVQLRIMFPTKGLPDELLLSFLAIGTYGYYTFWMGMLISGLSFRCIAGFFTVQFFFIAPFAIWSSGNWSLVPLPLETDYFGLKINLLCLWSLLSWHIGYRWQMHKKRIIPSELLRPREQNTDVSWLPLCVAVVASLAGAGVLGIGTFLFRSAVNDVADLNLWQTLILYLGTKSVILMALGYYLVRLLNGFTVSGLVCMLLTAALNLILNSPLGSARFFAFICIAGIAGLFLQRLKFRVFIMCIFIGMGLIGSNIAGGVRHARQLSDVQSVIGESADGAIKMDMLFTGAFDAYEVFGHGVSYVDEKGMDFGRQFAGAALFWIPRAFWEEKPIGTGRMLGESYIAGAGRTLNVNLSSPLPLEGYVTLGAAGVFIFCFTVGALGGYFDQRVAYVPKLRPWQLFDFLIFCLVGWSLFLWRGDLMNALSFLTCLLAAYYVIKISSRFGTLSK